MSMRASMGKFPFLRKYQWYRLWLPATPPQDICLNCLTRAVGQKTSPIV